MRPQEHRAAREAWLDRATALLLADDRFAAAWLAGSLGRGDADDWSDVDLWLAVAGDAVPGLCHGSFGFSASLSSERAALVESFGRPVVVGENGVNAGPRGVAMNIVYAEGLLVVDWYLVPAQSAALPPVCRLLFDKIGLEVERTPPPLPESERAARAAVEVAIFWYLMVPAAKSIRRGDVLHLSQTLVHLQRCMSHCEDLLQGRSPAHHRVRGSALPHTRAAQVSKLRELCRTMLPLTAAVADLGGDVPVEPMAWAEPLFEELMASTSLDAGSIDS